jgi:hypothetical protein
LFIWIYISCHKKWFLEGIKILECKYRDAAQTTVLKVFDIIVRPVYLSAILCWAQKSKLSWVLNITVSYQNSIWEGRQCKIILRSKNKCWVTKKYTFIMSKLKVTKAQNLKNCATLFSFRSKFLYWKKLKPNFFLFLF